MKIEKGDRVRINDTQSEFHKKEATVLRVGQGFFDVKVGTLTIRVVPEQIMFLAREGAQ